MRSLNQDQKLSRLFAKLILEALCRHQAARIEHGADFAEVIVSDGVGRSVRPKHKKNVSRGVAEGNFIRSREFAKTNSEQEVAQVAEGYSIIHRKTPPWPYSPPVASAIGQLFPGPQACEKELLVIRHRSEEHT